MQHCGSAMTLACAHGQYVTWRFDGLLADLLDGCGWSRWWRCSECIQQYQRRMPEVDMESSSTFTISGFASVDVSPTGSPVARFFRMRLMILPLRVFGSSGVKTIAFGRAIAPIPLTTSFISFFFISSEGSTPSLRMTNARIAWNLISSGIPTTAASATPSQPTKVLSSSMVPMRWPATLRTSSTRPSTIRYPSSSTAAPSPAK
mmetsp:Transcript_1779/g.3367  ORF Transcript_1779/g.3367 Transcript_1779/m.3367 type:complete len:204 (-) Transcript_1779:593-1204(-)